MNGEIAIITIIFVSITVIVTVDDIIRKRIEHKGKAGHKCKPI